MGPVGDFLDSTSLPLNQDAEVLGRGICFEAPFFFGGGGHRHHGDDAPCMIEFYEPGALCEDCKLMEIAWMFPVVKLVFKYVTARIVYIKRIQGRAI